MADNPLDYAWINLQNGTNVNPSPNGGTWQLGQPFFWANPAGGSVTVTGCSGFCPQNTYTVPPPTSGQRYGLAPASLLQNPTSWSFGPENPNQWNAPGMPHISNPPSVIRPRKDEAEVA